MGPDRLGMGCVGGEPLANSSGWKGSHNKWVGRARVGLCWKRPLCDQAGRDPSANSSSQEDSHREWIGLQGTA